MKRLLLPLLITLMLTPVLAAAQPQADSLRHLLRTQPHTPHLLAQMAQAFSTSCPDSALHYAQLATQHKAQGADIVTLEAARGEALAAQGHIQQALGHFTQAYKVAQNTTSPTSSTTNYAAWASVTAACSNSTRQPNATTKL